MTTTRIRPCGEAALLLDCADLAEAVALARRMEVLRPEAVDVVPAAKTVLVTVRDAKALPALRRRIEAVLADTGSPSGLSGGSFAEASAGPPSGSSVGPPSGPSVENPLPSRSIRYPHGSSGSGGGVADLEAGAGERGGMAGAGEHGGGLAGVSEHGSERLHTLDVVYDGPDLADVAAYAGLTPEELVRRHTQVTWRAAFGGFAPGFFYLVDDRDLAGSDLAPSAVNRAEGVAEGRANGAPGRASDAIGAPGRASDAIGAPGRASDATGAIGPASDAMCLPTVPRLASPRASVPAGSVGLADRFCAVYPGASPGGWRLLGTTDASLWDLDRERPALIAPGDLVRFRDVRGGEPRPHGGLGADDPGTTEAPGSSGTVA